MQLTTTPLGIRAMAWALPLLLAGSSAWAQPVPARDAADRPHGELFQPTGDPDRDFALMMRAHHQEGVDMANLEIANGKSTKLKAMARRIVTVQQQEIAELDKWTARHNLRLSRAK
jgi:uncharacterized protein (DUF305 family)